MVSISTIWKAGSVAAALAAMAVMPASTASAAKEKNKGKATAIAPATISAEPPMPSEEKIIMFIRSALTSLDLANFTNNYTVLYDMSSTSFRQSTTPQKMSEAFKSYRDNRANGLDLSPVLVLPPQLTLAPAVKNGQLHLTGFFPSRPQQLNYDLSYEVENGYWRLSSLAINLVNPPEPVPSGN